MYVFNEKPFAYSLSRSRSRSRYGELVRRFSATATEYGRRNREFTGFPFNARKEKKKAQNDVRKIGRIMLVIFYDYVPHKNMLMIQLRHSRRTYFSSRSHRRKRPNFFLVGKYDEYASHRSLCSLLVFECRLKIPPKKRNKWQFFRRVSKSKKNVVHAAGARAPRSCFNSEMSCILDMPVTRQSPFY